MNTSPAVKALFSREADVVLVAFLTTRPEYAAMATADQFEAMHDALAGRPDADDIEKAANVVGNRTLVSDYIVFCSGIFDAP